MKGDLDDVENGVGVGARRVGLSMSETADLQGFTCKIISGLQRMA